MANLVVADVCNLKCAYCFARDYLQSSISDSRPASRFISLDAFRTHLDFIDRSNINEIRIIGGEPTLHSNFPELISLALKREKHIVVFSHGLISETALACLEALPVDRCTVLINMNATGTPGQIINRKEQGAREKTLHRLGPRALLGFNIFATNFQAEFMLPLIEEANCRKAIRLGLAHPVVAGGNAYLHPKHYPIVGDKIARFARSAAEAHVKLELDCGFVRCMFSNENLEILRQAKTDIGWRCNPILDIGMDGEVFHCFPLSGKIQTKLTDGADANDLRTQLEDQTHLYRIAGIYKECSSCLFKQKGECRGGCLANTIKRFRQAAFSLSLPENTFN